MVVYIDDYIDIYIYIVLSAWLRKTLTRLLLGRTGCPAMLIATYQMSSHPVSVCDAWWQLLSVENGMLWCADEYTFQTTWFFVQLCWQTHVTRYPSKPQWSATLGGSMSSQTPVETSISSCLLRDLDSQFCKQYYYTIHCIWLIIYIYIIRKNMFAIVFKHLQTMDNSLTAFDQLFPPITNGKASAPQFTIYWKGMNC